MNRWPAEGLQGTAHCTQAPTLAKRELLSGSARLQQPKLKLSGETNEVIPLIAVPGHSISHSHSQSRPDLHAEEEEESKMSNDYASPYNNSVHMVSNSTGASMESKSMTPEEMHRAAVEEKKRKRKLAVAAASRANRLKKKKEFEELRDTNKKLLKERQMLVQMIQDLKSELEANRHSEDPALVEENAKLQKSVKTYRGTVKRLRSLLDGVPE